MSVLSSSPLRCSHSVTSRRREGGALGTDISAACAPASPVAYVLVLGLPSGSPTPCGVSAGKGGVFGWARLARATTLSSSRPCGTCPPSLRKPSASLVHPCSATMSQVCQSPAQSLRRGRVTHPEDARVSFHERGPGQWDGTTGTGHMTCMLSQSILGIMS